MELVGLFFAVLAALLVLYGLSKLGQIHQEIRRQTQILYEIAVALKADVPESLRPRAGFFAEFSRGLKGK